MKKLFAVICVLISLSMYGQDTTVNPASKILRTTIDTLITDSSDVD